MWDWDFKSDGLMDYGWSGLHVVFVVICWGECSKDMCMVALTPLWSKNAGSMMCVSYLCKAIWWGSCIRKWSMHVSCVGWCAGVKMGSCGPSKSLYRSVRR